MPSFLGTSKSIFTVPLEGMDGTTDGSYKSGLILKRDGQGGSSLSGTGHSAVTIPAMAVTGTPTDAYALYLNAPTGATNNYALYTSGKVSLTGALTFGTVGAGTWQGGLITGQYGGTGVANTGKTITLGGNVVTAGDFTTAGAFALTLTTTAATNVTFPTSGTLATLADVTAASQGLDVRASVKVKTTAELLSVTYGTNTISSTGSAAITAVASFDGQQATLAVNDRILVTEQGATTAANAKYNGIYVVTDLGSVSTAWVLTRASDFNTSALASPNAFAFIETGTVNKDTGWVLTTDAPITLNTTNLAFSQFSSTGSITSGTNTTVSSGQVNLNASISGMTNISFNNSSTGTTSIVPGASGSNTLTLPINTGTLLYIIY